MWAGEKLEGMQSQQGVELGTPLKGPHGQVYNVAHLLSVIETEMSAG